MAIRTFNSVGGFSVGEVPVSVISNIGDISNVGNANISNTFVVGNNTSNVTVVKTGDLTATGNIVAANLTSNALHNAYVTFAGTNGILKDSPNLQFNTSSNTLALNGSANISDGTAGNSVVITGSNGNIVTTGNLSVGNGAFTVDTNGDGVFSNSLVVGTNGEDSAFYVDAAGNFEIKLANNYVVFSVNAANGTITTAGSIQAPGGGATTVAAPGANTEIVFNDDDNLGASSLFTFDKNAQALTVDGNIQLSDATGTGYLVLPMGGYLYDGGLDNSAILHAFGPNGAAQLEYDSATFVYANSSGAYLSASEDSSNVQVLDNGGVNINAGSASVVVVDGANVTITSNAKAWDFKTDGNLSVPGSIWANAGDFELSGYANIGGTLNVVDTANLQGDTFIGGTLNVTATTNLFDDVTVGASGAGNSAALDVYGNLHVYENANIDGALTIGNLHVTNFVTSNLIPGTNEGLDLGNSDHRWKDLWLSGFTINLGNTTISSGGSNLMIVNSAIVGYGESVAGATYTPAVGNLYAGFFKTSNHAVIGNVTGTRANLLVSGNLAVDDTAAASSTTTGAFTVKGGVGIGGNIYVGGAIANITGDLDVNGANGVNITSNLFVGDSAEITNDLVVGGNLTVSGTTTYVNTTNSSITDALIDLGGDGSGGNITTVDTYDRGLLLRNADGSGTVNQFMGWKQSVGEFQLLTNVTDALNVVTGDFANLELNELYSTNVFGTIQTTTQDVITDMAGLENITVGTEASINLATVTTLVASGLNYPIADGSVPAVNGTEVVVLKTDGTANLSFQTIKTDRIANAESRVLVNEANVVVTANSTVMFKATEFGANIYGTFGVQGLLTAGSLNVGTLTPQSIAIGDTKIDDSTVTTEDDQQAPIAEVTAVAGNAVEFFVKGISDVGGVKYVTVATVTALYDGSGVDYATYGKLHMPSGGTGAGTLEVTYSGGNITLLATPSQNTETVWTAQIRTI